MKIHEIREIVKLFDQTGLSDFEIAGEESRLSLKKRRETVASELIQAPTVRQVQAVMPAPAPVVAAAAVEVALPVEEKLIAAKSASTVPTALPTDVDNCLKIVSPMVGTFYATPDPASPAFVQVGDKVNRSTVVCIVEAMKLFNEIEAEVEGEIIAVLVQNGQLVEHGQPLFLVKPE